MKIVKSYNYLIKPTKEQKEKIRTILNNVTFVCNQYIDDYSQGKDMHRYAKDILAEYKEKYQFLSKTDSSALMNCLFKMSDVNIKELKKVKNKKSYTTSKLYYGNSFYITNTNYLYLPKVGKVRMIMHRELPEKCIMKSVTIIIDSTNEYHASFTFEYQRDQVFHKINVDNIIGLDYSSKYLYVDSNGDKAVIPHFYRRQEERLSNLQRKLKTKKYGSDEYYKIKNKIAVVYKKTRNQRNDWLHKSSSSLIEKYDVVCLESLDMIEISQNHMLGKSTYDNGYRMFTKMLEYKSIDKGKRVVYIDKWFPSSKKCSCCGCVNKNISLNDREWICTNCGEKIDRDINAAINIREEGKRIITAKG